MAEINLKEYTTRIKELEAAIFTQERLMDEHKSLFDKQRPIKPQKPDILEPSKPFRPMNRDVTTNITMIIVFVVAVIIGVFLCSSEYGLIQVLGNIFVICGVFFLISTIVAYFKSQNEYEIALQNYEKEMQNYNTKMNTYRKHLSEINAKYPIELENYRVKSDEHESNVSKIMIQHENVLSCLKNSIQTVYEENVIFPKYRNLVAITAINEYLLSGRCDKLEGPEGAYNLYEMELRQNIIISQLSSIIDNLEQIKNNQFSLYQEIQKTNYIIEEILSEAEQINQSAKLTAYFARVTALAETSPKYYYGIVL